MQSSLADDMAKSMLQTSLCLHTYLHSWQAEQAERPIAAAPCFTFSSLLPDKCGQGMQQ